MPHFFQNNFAKSLFNIAFLNRQAVIDKHANMSEFVRLLVQYCFFSFFFVTFE